MFKAYREYWSKITVINASATRSQYWWPQLINIFLWVIFYSFTGVGEYIEITPENMTVIREWNTSTMLFVLFSFFLWLANFSVRARRLHDRNHSNWLILLFLIPIIGYLVILIMLILPSKNDTRWPINQSDYK